MSLRPFDEKGISRPPAFAALRTFFRCRHSGSAIEIDPGLIRLLLRISNRVGHRTIRLISGHRAAGVLRTKRTSQHVSGRAADIRIPGVGLQRLRAIALRAGAHGVGFYPHDRFVHVDARPGARVTWKQDDGTESSTEEGGLRPKLVNAQIATGSSRRLPLMRVNVAVADNLEDRPELFGPRPTNRLEAYEKPVLNSTPETERMAQARVALQPAHRLEEQNELPLQAVPEKKTAQASIATEVVEQASPDLELKPK